MHEKAPVWYLRIFLDVFVRKVWQHICYFLLETLDTAFKMAADAVTIICKSNILHYTKLLVEIMLL